MYLFGFTDLACGAKKESWKGQSSKEPSKTQSTVLYTQLFIRIDITLNALQLPPVVTIQHDRNLVKLPHSLAMSHTKQCNSSRRHSTI
jgi:hypothetical protein